LTPSGAAEPGQLSAEMPGHAEIEAIVRTAVEAVMAAIRRK